MLATEHGMPTICPPMYALEGYLFEDLYSLLGFQIPEIQEVLIDMQNSPAGNLISTPIIGGPTTCCSWYNISPYTRFI